MNNSICIFHNGNQRIVDYYKDKFSHLSFLGIPNDNLKDQCLYEICYIDANVDTLINLKNNNIKIIRHITTYEDDLKNPIKEISIVFDHNDWLNYVVTNYLCFSDMIVSDYVLKTDNNNKHAIITTGRTANKHYRSYLESNGIESFEYFREIEQNFLNSAEATLLWREDSWETATSVLIATQNYFFHNINGIHRGGEENFVIENLMPAGKLTNDWFMDWFNICQLVLNHALFYKFVLNKPITAETYNNVIKKYSTDYQKNKYNKEDLIENYHEAKTWYYKNIESKVNLIYNNTLKLLKNSNG